MAAAATVRSVGGRAARGKELEAWLVDAPNTVRREQQLDAQLLFSTPLWTAGASCTLFPSHRVCSSQLNSCTLFLPHIVVWLCVTDAALE